MGIVLRFDGRILDIFVIARAVGFHLDAIFLGIKTHESYETTAFRRSCACLGGGVIRQDFVDAVSVLSRAGLCFLL